MSTSALQDEYGKLDCTGDTYIATNFKLESGVVLKEAHARYNTFGSLNSDRNNLIVVCHALTGNSKLDQWWGQLLGPGKAFDTSKYMVVCANILGSCYGSSGPMSINPTTGKIYGFDFPQVTIRDTVRLHMEMVTQQIGAKQVACVIGGSMGGMQALEWTLLGAPLVQSAVIIGCGARHSAWQIAISSTQRQAIFNDPKWNAGHVDPRDPPAAGLSLARQIAMISYRTADSFDSKFGRDKVVKKDVPATEVTHSSACSSGPNNSKGGDASSDEDDEWQVQSYLDYQGRKFLDRFDAVSYVKITEQMDTHDVGRDRGGVVAALQAIHSRVLVLGIDSDILYPLSEQRQLAENIPQGILKVVHSVNGHDGFLLETNQVSEHIKAFLQ